MPPVIRRVSSLLTGCETQKAWGATPTLPPELEELLELEDEELELLELPAPELLLELDDELLLELDEDELLDELEEELELDELDELVGIVWVVAVRVTGVEALPLASIARRL